jgi:hypothetical protein
VSGWCLLCAYGALPASTSPADIALQAAREQHIGRGHLWQVLHAQFVLICQYNHWTRTMPDSLAVLALPHCLGAVCSRALEDIIALGIPRVLTSGGCPSAQEVRPSQ